MRVNITEQIKSKKYFFLFFSLVLLAGIFLRTYNFHDWLIFNLDQIRDAKVVEQVVNGEKPWPLLGPAMNHTDFHLGPAYYYFQIISAEFFGTKPEVLAYPDLFFSILTIPLLYIFFRKLFTREIAIALTSLYTFSHYAITYSRFAWNPNMIQFFVLAFLLSIYELTERKNERGFVWIISAGISLGIGVQLHAILLILWPIFLSMVAFFPTRQNKAILLKIAGVFLIAIFMNFGQIISEINNGLSNSKNFLSTLQGKTAEKRSNFAKKISMDLECHIQSNLTIPSALGNKDDCDFLYTKKIFGSKLTGSMKKIDTPWYFFGAILATGFSFVGYGLLFNSFKKAGSEEKNRFLKMIGLYAGISFLVLLPVGEDLRPRYFMHIYFVPYLFIGLLFVLIGKKRKIVVKIFIFSLFLLLITTNYVSIKKRAVELTSASATKLDSGYDSIVLGEIDYATDYLVEKSRPSGEAMIVGKAMYLGTFSEALSYVGDKKDLSLVYVKSEEMPKFVEKPLFLIAASKEFKDCKGEFGGYKIASCKVFGEIAFYELK